ncbi:apolipoprotein F-like [Perognathus longimembris pacificus]|uniref:apolipoprotein F-like n=1 Tax=Perognathus longimembris pacificus TaxID=214514 RepID=UPI002019FE6D|nr:apolipoprotein F-like [Perognathus longimembris pacificus]
MPSSKLITIAVGLLVCLLMSPADAISDRKQTNVSKVYLPSSLGPQLPSLGSLSCQTLLPKSLPGFNSMAPLPKFLVGLALRNALEVAGCQSEAWALQLWLFRLGGVNATQLLIHHLQGLQKGKRTKREISMEILASALQLLVRDQPGPKRAPRSIPTVDCDNHRENEVYNIIRLLPGVGTYYNLGTAVYYAVWNCSEKAKERGKEGAIDLGFDLLMSMAGASGGPAGIVISAALKPALKAGVHRLIQYYHAEKEVNTTSMEGLRGTSDVSDWEETITMAPLIAEVVSSPPSWAWALFKSYGLDLEAGSLGV